MLMGIVGGLFIGLAAVWLYLSLGRIAGISGIAANALLRAKENLWPLFFVGGMGVGGWLAYAVVGYRGEVTVSGGDSLWLLVGGLLVGGAFRYLQTRLSNQREAQQNKGLMFGFGDVEAFQSRNTREKKKRQKKKKKRAKDNGDEGEP